MADPKDPQGERLSAEESPQPQPTESEAIVAAERARQTPKTPLVPPVPLPVDQAGSQPTEP